MGTRSGGCRVRGAQDDVRERAEVRRLGAALTEFELADPHGDTVPVELLRELAAASRRLIVAIGECIVHVEAVPPDTPIPRSLP